MTAPLKRRWFAFSLRTLLILVLVLAVPLAWIAKEKRQSALELEIASRAGGRGGHATFDGRYEDDGTEIDDDSWRRFANSVIGKRVVRLEFGRYVFDDLEPFAELTCLKHFAINESKVSDLSPLAGQASLRSLTMRNSPVSDLSPLTTLINLEHLDLANCPVSNLQPLRGLLQLETVDLSNSEVNDPTPLDALVNLRTLDLRGTRVSREQAMQLKQALPKCIIHHHLGGFR